MSATGYSVPTGYRVHSLVQLFQQLVTECADQVPATQPLYNHPPPPPPPPNWLQSHPTQSIQPCVDSGAGKQLVSTRYGFNQLVTESTDRPHSLH